jgi:signal transduction histidine kinase
MGAYRWLPRVPSQVVDVLLMTVVLVAQLAPFVSNEPTGGAANWSWQMYLPPVAASVPVLWWRRAPFLVLVACLAAAVAYRAFPLGAPQPIWYGLLVGIFKVAERGPRWQRVTLLAGIAVGAVVLTGSLATTARGVLTVVAAYAMGRAWAARRLHLDMLAERAQHLERENALAVERERARIVRDLHDILAHGMTVMVAQAQAGAADVRRHPERAEASFEAITTVGRDAMAQLRRVVGRLGPSDAPVARPRLAGLAELAARVSAAGLRVTVSETGQIRSLEPEGEVAAYRIVQEALTNAVKHADATAVEIRLVWHERELVVSVDDDGRGPAGGSGGQGLIGMAERARACGGTASAGSGHGGRGFRVSARLPVVASMAVPV